jgi:hypothetical protein
MRTLREMFSIYDGKCCSAGVASAINKVRQRARLRNTWRPLTKYVLSSLDLESRVYAGRKLLLSGPASKPRPTEVPGPKWPKGGEVFEEAERIEIAFLRLGQYIMNEFTDKNEQAFLNACGAIGIEPNAMMNTQKERYLVSEFLKNPVSWLETESLYHSYTTRGEAREVANGIDRMISEGAPIGQSKLSARAKHSSAPSDTAFGS